MYERTEDGWVELETPVEANLLGVTNGDDPVGLLTDPVDVAVGEGGTIVERQ